MSVSTATQQLPKHWQQRARITPKKVLLTTLAVCGATLIMVLPTELNFETRLTLTVFFGAVWLWIFTRIEDTYVALGAATVLVLAGVLPTAELFSPLGDSTTWLLIGAFIIAAALTRTGLATRATRWLTVGVKSPRMLVHLTTLALVLTAFMVPATSGRAALVLPVFLALVPLLGGSHRWLLITLSVLLPSVVLFSAIASLIGAGAHLITDQILAEQGHGSIGFTQWLLYGLPYALVISHLSAEVILFATSSHAQRRGRLSITAGNFPNHKPFTKPEVRSLIVLAGAVLLWLTESLHSIHPALVALIGALLITSKTVRAVPLNAAIKKIPWSLLLFMTATVALAAALSHSGAINALANAVFQALPAGPYTAWVFVGCVIVISSLAHLLIQSRSARSAALIPLVIALAIPLGVNPVAAAFISTAAAGFCHSMPAAAKPLAIFHSPDGSHPSFTPKQLLGISLLLMPLHLIVLAFFAVAVWPLMGLSLFL